MWVKYPKRKLEVIFRFKPKNIPYYFRFELKNFSRKPLSAFDLKGPAVCFNYS